MQTCRTLVTLDGLAGVLELGQKEVVQLWIPKTTIMMNTNCFSWLFVSIVPDEKYSAGHFVAYIQIVRFASALHAKNTCHQRGKQQSG